MGMLMFCEVFPWVFGSFWLRRFCLRFLEPAGSSSASPQGLSKPWFSGFEVILVMFIGFCANFSEVCRILR